MRSRSRAADDGSHVSTARYSHRPSIAQLAGHSRGRRGAGFPPHPQRLDSTLLTVGDRPHPQFIEATSQVYEVAVRTTPLLKSVATAIIIFSVLPAMSLGSDGPVRLSAEYGQPWAIARPHGGLFVAHTTSTGIRLFATLPSGLLDPAWPPEGRQLAVQTLSYPVALVPDQSGGFYAAWTRVLGTDFIPRLGHFRADGGAAPGWPDSGKTLSSPSYQSFPSPALTLDQTGGVYVAWAAQPGQLRVGRFLESGALAAGWPAAGIEARPGGSASSGPTLVFDSLAGGVVVLALQSNGYGPMVWAQRFKPNGSLATGWPTQGVFASLVQQSSGYEFAATSDGYGGALATWREWSAYEGFGVYSARFGWNASLPWNTPSYPRLASSYSESPSIASDQTGGLFATWYDMQGKVQLQHVNYDGSVQFPLGGLLLATSATGYAYPRCFSDGRGGSYLVWVDMLDSPTQLKTLRALRVNAQGEPFEGWPSDGLPLSTANGMTTNFCAVSDSAGGVHVLWSVSPFGASGIYVRYVLPDGSSPSTLDSPAPMIAPKPSRMAVRPSIANRAVRISLSAELRGPIQILDIGGRCVRTLIAADGGAVELNWDLRDANGLRVAPGLYFVRCSAHYASVSQRVVVLR